MKEIKSGKSLMRTMAVLGMLCAGGLLTIGCFDGAKMHAQQQHAREKAEQIHDRAYRCAPYELAMATAHAEFTHMELSDGNGRRANVHAPIAEEMIESADKKSNHPLCQDPKTQDRDKDGIIDSQDKCPDVPGTKAFFGCPDPDLDKDKVCDLWVSEMNLNADFPNCQGMDHCPKEKGELAYSGCTNPDSDGDGICNPWVAKVGLQENFAKTCKDSDLCEDVPGLAEFKGCPKPDLDGDGVCDPWVAEKGLSAEFKSCQGSDKCPAERGSLEENGCPPPRKFIVVTETSIDLKEQFFFATNKTKVLKKSEPLLDEIAEVLKDNPNIHISIEGHTDSSGKRRNNLKLSDGRAKSVMQELVKRGIAKERMTYKGYGPDQPIDTNDTPEGRANNRRVDLKITKR